MSIHNIEVNDRTVKTIVIHSIPQLDGSLKELLSNMSQNTDLKRVVGLDIEKDYNPSPGDGTKLTERVVSVNLCYGTTVLIIQLLHLNAPPCSLAKFLQLQELSFVSIGMKHCMEALEKDYGIKCRNAVDLGQLAATKKGNDCFKAYGLLDLADKVCVLGMNKMKEMSSVCNKAALGSWGRVVMSKEQVAAAAWRGFLCFWIGNHLLGGHLSSESSSPTYHCDYDGDGGW